MRVIASGLSLRVEDVASLEAALARRDGRGGGFFWLAPDDRDYPAFALRVSDEVADVCYFPADGHAGFRCLGGEGLPEGGLTTLVYDGCDPGTVRKPQTSSSCRSTGRGPSPRSSSGRTA